MAKEEHDQLNLTVVALVALVAIVGLVALVLNVVNLARISTGVGQVSAADDANLAGDPVRYPTYDDGSGIGGSGGSSMYCNCRGPSDPDAGNVCSGYMLRTACTGQQGCYCT